MPPKCLHCGSGSVRLFEAGLIAHDSTLTHFGPVCEPCFTAARSAFLAAVSAPPASTGGD